MTLHVEGARPPLSGALELAAYRIVQEALTNARRHAPGAHATVTTGYHPGHVGLHILDDGPGPATGAGVAHGHGLNGMRERVTLLGGHLTYGRGPRGGFLVASELPSCRYLLRRSAPAAAGTRYRRREQQSDGPDHRSPTIRR
ncbi:sensor histidine kinase [Streptomyces decoyicus]|uniref:sensor histidine kinase n=1 Tax=Streptomyces decoyicus TaxID=249567 RepID=UPI0038640484